jgi:Mg-chelatase subunit ChlI
LQENDREFRLRMGPLRGGDSAVAIALAAAGIADCQFSGLRGKRTVAQQTVAAMNSLAEAARTRRWGGHSQNCRGESSHEREQQQQSGGEAMHGSV